MELSGSRVASHAAYMTLQFRIVTQYNMAFIFSAELDKCVLLFKPFAACTTSFRSNAGILPIWSK